jgi:hypothetical protein
MGVLTTPKDCREKQKAMDSSMAFEPKKAMGFAPMAPIAVLRLRTPWVHVRKPKKEKTEKIDRTPHSPSL